MIFNNKKIVKNPMDERNDAFMQASKEAADQYLAENQDNPMAFMDVLKGSITPPQETQIPFTSEIQPQVESIETEEVPQGQVEDLVNQVQQAPNRQPSSVPTAPDNYSRILAELRAMREGSDEGISAARRADSTNELIGNLNKSFSTIGDALANRAGITKIKSDPLAIKSNLAEQAEADRKRKLESLMSEYKMISDKEAKDADRKYKQDMLDLQKDKLLAKGAEKTDKEMETIRKENRKIRQDMEKSLTSMDEQLKNIREAESLLKNAKAVGTGPLDQYIAKFTPHGQKLETALNKLALDKMVSMFQGMSKAVDSDAERRFFQSAQADMSKFDKVNLDILKQARQHLENLKKKTQSSIKRYDSRGNELFDADLVDNSQQTPTTDTPPIGSIINAKGKRYRVIDNQGNLEEVR